MMWHALVGNARKVIEELSWTFLRRPPAAANRPAPPASPVRYQSLQRLLLTDGVGRTLFEEYAAHRAETRGEEETGWVLMGVRDASQAIALATLPAGAFSDASVAHVRFNSTAQALGSRIVRQNDKRLTILGVVHTHPGSLRHPSDGDFRGDSQWVRHLRGGEGVFGIGTAEGIEAEESLFAEQPRPHVQCMADMCLSWYALGQNDARYRPLPVGLTLGPDLARPLHSVWSVVETHAERLERLFKQQAGVTFEVRQSEFGFELIVNVPLSEPQHAVRVALAEKGVKFFLKQGDELVEADCPDERVDRGVYLLLAELAAKV
jgi:proteasome lid subunit RPN8/RPN11